MENPQRCIVKMNNFLEHLAPADVYPITSDNLLRIKGADGNGTETEIVIIIPLKFANQNLLTLYQQYLVSPEFNKLSSSTRYDKANTLRNFINFLSSFQFDTDFPIPKDIFRQYFVDVIKNSERTSLYNLMLNLRTPLKHFIEGKLRAELNGLGSIADYLSNMPNTPPPESVPKDSMSTLFEKECLYTDHQLITGLRLLCCVLLEQLHIIRQEIRSNYQVTDALINLCNSGLINHSIANKVNFEIPSKTDITKAEDFESVQKVGALIVEQVIKTTNPILKELFLEGMIGKNYPEGLGSQDVLCSFFKEVITPQKTSRFNLPSQKKIRGKTLRMRSQCLITPRFVAGITDAEAFLIQCLLASDSVQRSGLLKHKLSDFSIDPKSMQGQFAKPRRAKGSATPIYKRNTLIYEAYSRHVHEMEKIQEWIPQQVKGKTLHYSSINLYRGAIGLNLPALKILEVLCKPKSYLRNHILSVTEGEVKPILWLIDRIRRHNSVWANRRRATTVKQDTIGLTADAISMSRKRLDDEIAVFTKSDDSASGHSVNKEDERVSAELTAHSVAIKKNVYNLRSKSKEKIKSMRRFGEQVATLMETDSVKVKRYMDTTKFVSLKEIKKILDLTDLADDFQSMLSSVESGIINIWGGITLHENTYIIANETTAMLLYGFIEHIKIELPSLFNDSEVRAKEAQIQLAYLSEIFYRFPESIKQKGMSMFLQYDISYPSLK